MDNSQAIVTSETTRCEILSNSCTDIIYDNLDNSQAIVTSETTQCEIPTNYCTSTYFDKLGTNPPPIVEVTASTKSSKTLVTHLTRNPPKLPKEVWEKYNTEFSEINKESWATFKKGMSTPEQYVSDLNAMLASYLESKVEFQKETREFFKHAPINEEPLEAMRKEKINLNKQAKKPNATEAVKEQARHSIRMYSHMIKVHKEKKEASLKREQDKSYRKDFWKTVKDVTNGTFGMTESAPTFNKATADDFYKLRYEKPVNIDLEKLDWFPSVDPPQVPYDLSPYTPKNIKAALEQKDKTSSPGYDEIVYEYLLKMPFLHQALATAFTRIREEGVAPDSWAKSKVILIKKDPEATDDEPTHFRMISLTLNIGKLYHTLEAGRTLRFMLENKYLDPMAQKAYVNGINGCMEHVTVVQEVIQHAKLNKKTLHATWFDLQDAFGSVAHELIPYVMEHYHIPKQVITYIISLYSKLEGKVVTRDWESELFNFLKGVFQGDPFSGIIFLIIFNPLIEYIKHHSKTHGYQLSTIYKGVKSVVTTPFADDFNVITQNKNMHQKLITDIAEKI